MMSVIPVFASETSIDVDSRTIKLLKSDKSFKIEVNVSSNEKFAGVELGIKCSDNISLESSSATAGSMSASPKKADGIYWTSFFESSNKMPANVTVTLQFKCPENTDYTSAVIEQVNILTRDGAGVVTERHMPNIKIIAGTSKEIAESENNRVSNADNKIITTDKKITADGADSSENTGKGSANSTVKAASSGTMQTGADNYYDISIYAGLASLSAIILCVYIKCRNKTNNDI